MTSFFYWFFRLGADYDRNTANNNDDQFIMSDIYTENTAPNPQNPYKFSSCSTESITTYIEGYFILFSEIYLAHLQVILIRNEQNDWKVGFPKDIYTHTNTFYRRWCNVMKLCQRRYALTLYTISDVENCISNLDKPPQIIQILHVLWMSAKMSS